MLVHAQSCQRYVPARHSRLWQAMRHSIFRSYLQRNIPLAIAPGIYIKAVSPLPYEPWGRRRQRPAPGRPSAASSVPPGYTATGHRFRQEGPPPAQVPGIYPVAALSMPEPAGGPCEPSSTRRFAGALPELALSRDNYAQSLQSVMYSRLSGDHDE